VLTVAQAQTTTAVSENLVASAIWDTVKPRILSAVYCLKENWKRLDPRENHILLRAMMTAHWRAVLEHKQDLFVWLKQKWADLFQADFEVLLYDLTSTYFEGEMEQNPKAKRGYSRDKRPDCLQLVIALVVTPDGFPLAYEVMNGNTSERTTLRDFLKKIETTYGRARRVWVMDRGIPSEAILQEMREPERQTFYLVGTPKARINQHEKKWLNLPWQSVRDSVEVKLYQHESELYVLAKSQGRQAKENAMRRNFGLSGVLRFFSAVSMPACFNTVLVFSVLE
jgi:hypothetical protein